MLEFGSGGDLDGALATFRADLAIAERLAGQDPGNAGWQRDLMVSRSRIGDIQLQLGDAAAALAMLEPAAVQAEKLAALDPTNAQAPKDRAWIDRLLAGARAAATRHP